MNTNTTMTLLETFKPTDSAGTGVGQLIKTTFVISGQSIDFCLKVPDEPIQISDLVPAAQAIAEKVFAFTVERQKQQDSPIACRKGCSACCNYLVALSRPEIAYIRQKLSQMDAGYQHSVLKSSVESARKILHNSSPIHEISQQPTPEQLSRWYASLNLSCPFLVNGVCGIYEHRPLACREHLAAGHSNLCDNSHPGQPEIIEPPFSILEALGQLDAELNQSDIEAVILPLALIETNDNDEQTEPQWNAVQLVNRLLEIIKKKKRQYNKTILRDSLKRKPNACW